MSLAKLQHLEVREKFHCGFQKRWTDQDIETLKTEFPKCPLVELCLILGRSPGGVISKLTKLKLVWCMAREFRFVESRTGKHYITWREIHKLKEKLQCSTEEPK